MLPNILPTSNADHTPVLADEVRELLRVQPGETVVDATFGAGGHATLLAEDLAGEGKLVAIDRDPGAKSYFDRFKARAGIDVRFLRGDFAIVLTQLAANGIKADAILLDLGISSMQVDRPERGFSYATDAPLDMRMDPSSETTAAAIVNTWDEPELVSIFRRFGEERFAAPIARALIRRRAERPFTRTGDLVDVDQARDPDAGALRRGPPCEAGLPGAAHRGERRARPARGGAPGGARDAAPGWSARRDLVPLARGSDRQAVPRGAGEGLHLPARLSDLRLRERADAAPALAQAASSGARRDRRQSACRLGSPPRRGAHLMSTIAQTAPSRRTRRARRTGLRGAFTSGVVWIVGVAALLAGVVVINVLALRLNVELDELRRTRAELKAEIATTRAQLSTASANERIVDDAATKLGLVEHDPNATTTVRLEAP